MDKKYTAIKLDLDSAFPIANQLARKLTWLAAAEDIHEGEKLPNIREFAAALGIHMHTVRAAYHILESQQLVTIRPRIGTIVKKYTPFPVTYRQGEPMEGLVGVLIPDMSDFYQQVMAGITACLAKENLIPVVIPCNEDPYFAETTYKTISARNFAGVLNISIGFSEEYYQVLKEQNNLFAPLVFVDDFAAFGHRILLNTSTAIASAVQHLARHNRRHIALVNCPQDWEIGKEVLGGYRIGLKEAGLPYIPEQVFSVPDFTFEAGRFCGEKIAANQPMPDAIAAAGDALALGAIAAFKANGLKVPGDIAVVGYNDIPISRISEPPLTTIALPAFQVGARAAEALLSIIKGKNKSWIREVFGGELVVRKSCGC